MNVPGLKVATLPILYYKNTSMEKALDRLFIEADKLYRDGVNILILSDRGVDENHVAIPSLLAVISYAEAPGKNQEENSGCDHP